jgi:hypothetical protein
MVWRVGRSLGRTCYEQVGDEPSKADPFLGIMDTKKLAERVVEAVNHHDEVDRQYQNRYNRLNDEKRELEGKVDDGIRLEAQMAERIAELEKERGDMQAQFDRLVITPSLERIKELEQQNKSYFDTIEAYRTQNREHHAYGMKLKDHIKKLQDERNRILDANANQVEELEQTIADQDKRIEELEKYGGVDEAKRSMVTELDWALHGETVARDQSPQEVWHDLLGKVRMLKDRLEAQEEHLKELSDVILREERIHNEAAAGMIAKVEKLERDDADWRKVVDQQEATLQLRQNLLNERESRIMKLEKTNGLHLAHVQRQEEHIMELEQANSKLQQDLGITEPVDGDVPSNPDYRFFTRQQLENTLTTRTRQLAATEKDRDRLVENNERGSAALEREHKRVEELEMANRDLQDPPMQEDFGKALAHVINYFGIDAKISRPDWAIADVIAGVIALLDNKVDIALRVPAAEHERVAKEYVDRGMGD